MGSDPVPAGEGDGRETDESFGRRVFWLRPKGEGEVRRVEHDANGKDQHDRTMNMKHINEAEGRGETI